MKKLFGLLFSVTITLGLTACANTDENVTFHPGGVNDQIENQEDQENQGHENNNEPEPEPDTEEVNNGEENNIDAEQDNLDIDEESPIIDELFEFEEVEVLGEQIDLERLSAYIQTDNPNNRVIIFADKDNVKQYKSIFMKRQNRLKIIQLDDEGQIFNEVIE